MRLKKETPFLKEDAYQPRALGHLWRPDGSGREGATTMVSTGLYAYGWGHQRESIAMDRVRYFQTVGPLTFYPCPVYY